MYSDEEKERAFTLYCEEKTADRIAKTIGVSRQTIEDCRRKREWKRRRKAIRAAALQRKDESLAIDIADMLKEHHAVAGELRNAVEKAITNEYAKGRPDPMALERISKAHRRPI